MFQINDYVYFDHHTLGRTYGTIKDMDSENDGWYDDDDNYIEGDSWLTYYVEYDFPRSDGWGGTQTGWWCNEEDITLVKKERVLTGFATFVKKVEEAV